MKVLVIFDARLMEMLKLQAYCFQNAGMECVQQTKKHKVIVVIMAAPISSTHTTIENTQTATRWMTRVLSGGRSQIMTSAKVFCRCSADQAQLNFSDWWPPGSLPPSGHPVARS